MTEADVVIHPGLGQAHTDINEPESNWFVRFLYSPI